MDERKIMEDAVQTMSRYVQFDTTNPPGNEMPAALWLADQLTSRGITSDIRIHEPVAGRGLVLARIAGTEALKPLMLNHHIDVVAADASRWTQPPFSGEVAGGFVWGRGTLDTKGLGVMFLLALESLLKEGAAFRRPIVFTAVPDEEPGGENGMRWLVEHHLKEIDPEWVWDEGSGGLKDVFGKGIMFAVAVAEKQIYRVRLIATGDPGHGSMPHPNSANVTLLSALSRIVGNPCPLRVDRAAAPLQVTVVDDQYGRLTFTKDMAEAIFHLLDSGAPFGTYDLTGSGAVRSWADIARAVFEAANGNGDRVVPVSTADYYASAEGPVAPRPVHSALDLSKLESVGFHMPDWEEELAVLFI